MLKLTHPQFVALEQFDCIGLLAEIQAYEK